MEGGGVQEKADDGSNVSLFPPPPYFPSDLHGHLAALAGTTSVFPLGRLLACLPVCLSARLQVFCTVVLVVHSITLPVCLSSTPTVCLCVWPVDSFSL